MISSGKSENKVHIGARGSFLRENHKRKAKLSKSIRAADTAIIISSLFFADMGRIVLQKALECRGITHVGRMCKKAGESAHPNLAKGCLDDRMPNLTA